MLLLLCLLAVSAVHAADRPLDEGVKGGIAWRLWAAPDGAADARLVNRFNRNAEDIKATLEIGGQGTASSLLTVFIPRQGVWRDGDALLTVRHGFRSFAIRAVVPGVLNAYRIQSTIDGRERVEMV